MESSRPGAHLGTGAGHSSTVKKFSGSYTSSKASSSAAVKTGHRRRLSATISTAPVHAKVQQRVVIVKVQQRVVVVMVTVTVAVRVETTVQ